MRYKIIVTATRYSGAGVIPPEQLEIGMSGAEKLS